MFRARGIPDNPKSNYRLAEIHKMICRLVAWWWEAAMNVAALSKLRAVIQIPTLAALMLTTNPPVAQDDSPAVEDIGAVLLIIGCFDDLLPMP